MSPRASHTLPALPLAPAPRRSPASSTPARPRHGRFTAWIPFPRPRLSRLQKPLDPRRTKMLAARSTSRAVARSAAPVRAVVARPALRLRQVGFAGSARPPNRLRAETRKMWQPLVSHRSLSLSLTAPKRPNNNNNNTPKQAPAKRSLVARAEADADVDKLVKDLTNKVGRAVSRHGQRSPPIAGNRRARPAPPRRHAARSRPPPPPFPPSFFLLPLLSQNKSGRASTTSRASCFTRPAGS